MTLDQIHDSISALRQDLVRSNPPEIMTSRECAAFMDVSDETLVRWRKDGFGPPYSQPNSRIVRYLRSDVIDWLREHQNG
ncbi:MAG: helix-turn-helix domain-containing protein [Dinoroseobacter sp.]|nr:helix-turn-helix domain-containing protein [Dinoroseobacter sp.]